MTIPSDFCNYIVVNALQFTLIFERTLQTSTKSLENSLKKSVNCKALMTMQWQKSLGMVMETVNPNRDDSYWRQKSGLHCTISPLLVLSANIL